MKKAFTTIDISKERVMSKDPLTELFNREFLLDWIEPNFKLYMRQQRLMGCVMIKINNFEDLYDSHGKNRGDFVLKDFASLTQTTFRDSDIVVRYNGPEFVVIMPDAGLDESLQAATRFQKIINDKCIAAFPPGEITCSMVVDSWCPESTLSSGEKLLEDANSRLASTDSFEIHQMAPM